MVTLGNSHVNEKLRRRGAGRALRSGSRQKKAPLRRGFEVPSSSLRTTRWFAVSLCGARLSDSNESAQRTGTSRHHEHLNFAAETCGADAPASIVRPACSSTRHIVPDNYNKLGAAVTRARVDPQVSVGMSFQLRAASAHHCLDHPPGKSRKLLFGRYFRQLIVLIPKENTMSQFVDSEGPESGENCGDGHGVNC
jgi:hypothetical protein